MKRTLSIMGTIVILALLAACGPSPEEVATMTASAWTPTPIPPTQTPVPPTPTPIPFDLTVIVSDETGVPIAGANIVFPESGSGEPAQSDEQGKFSWNNLASETATFKVSAQGYVSAEQSATLQRGVNEVGITLNRAPFGLLPSEACADGEEMLYAEDFQDGEVQDWGVYPPGAPILIEADIDEQENKILLLNWGDTDGEYQVNTLPIQDNVVRRFMYKPGNHSRFNTGFGKGNPGYFVVLSADEISLNFYSEATGEQKLMVGKPAMSQGIWHLLELSSYNGRIEVWVDGTSVAFYDGTSLTEGKILGMGSAFLPPDSVVRVDNISICGMTAPFTSIFTASP